MRCIHVVNNQSSNKNNTDESDSKHGEQNKDYASGDSVYFKFNFCWSCSLGKSWQTKGRNSSSIGIDVKVTDKCETMK
jgi:hypothetical protein